MEPIIESLIAGFPILILHVTTTLAILVVGIAIYIRVTPHDEMKLIKDGNTAAAVSLSGAIMGIALPLALCMAASVNTIDIIVWGCVIVAVQILAFKFMDFILLDLSSRIERNEMAPAILMTAVKLALALVNAAAISG